MRNTLHCQIMLSQQNVCYKRKPHFQVWDLYIEVVDQGHPQSSIRSLPLLYFLSQN